MSARPPVAIVHDYLTQLGGAERVVLEMTRAFPGAPLYTSMYTPDLTYPEFRDVDVRATVLNRFGPLRRHHRAAFPFLAPVFSATRVEADVVVCSSSGWAHGVRTSAPKVVYCHAIAHWLWQPDRYLGDGGSRRTAASRAALACFTPALRHWDAHAAASADRYLVNSTVTRDAVRRCYGIDADVLAPPLPRVDVRPDALAGADPGFFLCVARLLPYKNVGPVADAFAALAGERLVVVGDGPELARLRERAPANVRFSRRLPDSQLRWCYEQCAGLVAASYEDFGLTVVEAAAAGRPVVALRAGGYLDTVVDGVTGLFFAQPDAAAIAAAVRRLRSRTWDDAAIRAHAATFGADRFDIRLREIVADIRR